MTRIILNLMLLFAVPSLVSATQFSYHRLEYDRVELRLQLIDDNGALITTGGSNVEIVVPPFSVDASSVTDNGDGTYSVILSSSSASSFPISVVADGIQSDVGSVTFFAGVPAPVFTTMQPIYNGNAVITVRVNLADRNFNRVQKGGHDIELYSEEDSVIINSVVDNRDGTYDVTFMPDDPFTGSGWGGSLSMILNGSYRYLNFYSYLPNFEPDGILGAIEIVESSANSAKVELTLYQNGEVLTEGHPDVRARVSVSNVPQSPEVIDEGAGIYSVIVNGEPDDVGSVTFELFSKTTALTMIEFKDENQVAPPLADIETITNSDGSITLNMTMLDQDGNTITYGGYEVIVTATGQTSVGDVIDNQDGTYTTQLTSTSGGSSEVSLEVNGVEPRAVQTVSFNNNSSSSGNNSSSGGGGGGSSGFLFLICLLLGNRSLKRLNI